MNLNNAFIEELYFDYIRNPESVSTKWQDYFKSNLKSETDKTLGDLLKIDHQEKEIAKLPKQTKEVILNNGNELEQLNVISSRIAENMEHSLEIPTAVSQRAIPVKTLDENRRIINKHLIKLKKSKISFTHILAYALVKALKKYPQMNDSYVKQNGHSFRVKKNQINLGLAIDLQKKDGTRILLVPSIKDAGSLYFAEFCEHYDNLIHKSRNNKITPDDMDGTTVTLTNPGMIGTTSSNPRLMIGQGLIIATGSINYPIEFQAVRPEVLTRFAVSKTLIISSTYDHRIIQGAESAEFLSYIEQLLIGEEQFYEQIFTSLNIPFAPVRWELDVSPTRRTDLFDLQEKIEKNAHLMLMINAYRVRGHLLASINPLGTTSYYYPELDPSYYGFNIWDLDRIFHADDSWENNEISLRDIIELLRETYCGHIGIEYMYIQDPFKKEWIKTTLELSRNEIKYPKEERIRIFKKIIDAQEFENFLHTKFVGHKRFSLEGAESIIVILDTIFSQAADDKLSAIMLGMAHRGRLNIIHNSIGKPLNQILNEFEGIIDYTEMQGSGDVKYHLGSEGHYTSQNGNKIFIKLAPNPSHLEIVDSVVEGMTRAWTNEVLDASHTRTLPVIIHGDSAFAGQGVVAETLNLSQLDGYFTGGTIHIIINNQIGFTTTAEEARSTIYATDIAKMIQVPILHVNGNDPEAVCTAAIFAYNYREKFHSDVIIDMLCYRKYGHNEGDEPTYTQPLLYKKIHSMVPVGLLYKQELIKENIISEDDANDYISKVIENFYDIFNEHEANKIATIHLNKPKNQNKVKYAVNTNISTEYLQLITNAMTYVPEEFNLHPKLKSLISKRAEMMSSDSQKIDWAMAELLAFGSILLDKKEIRCSGQDTRRGTFSQRHSVFTDTENEDLYVQLNHIRDNQAVLRIFDSPLSELSILGFEYGYSVIARNSLTIWEAQFGDFSNMAQPIIDQFIAASEIKWGQTSNLVMLLPHSYDGQGPEHSSARLERYLQLCADNNLIVCNLSTPAQYFHALRRQTLMENKKPLIIMTPKSMLRNPIAVSSPNELLNGRFSEILDYDGDIKPDSIDRIVFCSGKIYYDALSEIKKRNINNIALIRIEQLYPLNFAKLEELILKYKSAKDVVFMQEEPQNMGAWNFINNKLSSIMLGHQKLIYCGRKESASTATGLYPLHVEEQNGIINEALSVKQY